MKKLLPLVVVAAVASVDPSAALAAGAVERGARVYQRVCAACHSLDRNRTGPAHRGVFGRRAGEAPGFAYSRALRSSTVRWTETTLEAWLSDPAVLIPGQRMFFALRSRQDRADVIAYLKAQPERQEASGL